MKSILHTGRQLLLALMVAGTLAACDSSTAALEEGAITDEELELFAAELSSELGLTNNQAATLTASVAQNAAMSSGSDDPGFLWRLAAELSVTLTDAQIDSLLNGRGRGLGDFTSDRPMGPPQRDGQRGGGIRDILTDDQKADLEAIKQARRAELQELFAALRAAREAGDTVAAEAAHEAIKAIHDEVKAEVEAYLDANLTQEQKDAIAAAQAEREAAQAEYRAAVRAAMIEVLGITEAQADELQAAQEAFKEAVQGIDRSGDVRAQIEALRVDLEAAVSATLNNDAAFQVWQIHAALAHRIKKHRRGGPNRGNRGDRGQRGSGSRPAGGGAGG